MHYIFLYLFCVLLVLIFKKDLTIIYYVLLLILVIFDIKNAIEEKAMGVKYIIYIIIKVVLYSLLINALDEFIY